MNSMMKTLADYNQENRLHNDILNNKKVLYLKVFSSNLRSTELLG